MNVPIIDPLQGDFPEIIEDFLQYGSMKCIAFNSCGTLLAAGCSDGNCIIWDFETRGISRKLRDSATISPITSVCWSKHGHRLLVSATDKSLTLWDVKKCEKISRITLQQTALHARLDPGALEPTICLACPLSSAPLLVDISNGSSTSLPVSVSQEGNNYTVATNPRKFSDGSTPFTPTAATFDWSGEVICVGNSKGEILIVGTKTSKVYAIIPVPGGAVIKDIVFSRSGLYVLTNSNDRVIRLFENLLPHHNTINELETIDSSNNNTNNNVEEYDIVDKLKTNGTKCMKYLREFQDVVTKIQWKTPCFSGDDEWILGASASKGEHKLYIWERLGHLVKILEGPKEAIIDLVWHPERPIVVSVSVTGTAYVWAKDYVENWSAFAPDFKELEENEEYIEKEDEFDINPREDEKEKEEVIDEDAEVDIDNSEDTSILKASNGSYGELRYLAAVPSPEQSEQQDKYPASPIKLEESNNSASPFDMDVVANGHASSPMEGSEFFFAEEDGGTSLKRKRKPSAKGMEMQAEKDKKPVIKNPKSSSLSKISKPRTKYEFDSDQDDEFTDGFVF
ncbi:retinoblastoma-binding protein 5 [Carex littledalei]|uniref:Retinoblastoma-binding protein 5 n=1 Tax=Carex littledalei TaxID=544730 RepID=A0A833VMB1_9POAL|nr:retinoblastoma-binding protein 5 [Carex littledalei]